MHKMLFKKMTWFLILVIFITLSTNSARAEELVVTDNGANSNNQINLSNDQQTTVTQSNQDNTSNSVKTEASTGDNNASANNGSNTQVSTGDSTNKTSVANNANTSQASLSCGCPSDPGTSGVTVSGNGPNSENSANLVQNSQTTISVNQNSTIQNNITGYADTGNNSASFNTGNVSITTGNIWAENKISNTGVNQTSVEILGNLNSTDLVKIIGNGFYSSNQNSLVLNSDKNIYIKNNSDLVNILNFFGNTGENKADFNSGDVWIKTGDLALKNIIENKVNLSEIIDSCSCQNMTTPPPVNGGPSSPPSESSPPGSGSPSNSGGSSGGGGGEVLGVSVGPGLPATGDNSLLGYTLLALLMLGAGIYLRIQPKATPAFVMRYRYNTLHLI